MLPLSFFLYMEQNPNLCSERVPLGFIKSEIFTTDYNKDQKLYIDENLNAA